jgi:hypothetical protein
MSDTQAYERQPVRHIDALYAITGVCPTHGEWYLWTTKRAGRANVYITLVGVTRSCEIDIALDKWGRCALPHCHACADASWARIPTPTGAVFSGRTVVNLDLPPYDGSVVEHDTDPVSVHLLEEFENG